MARKLYLIVVSDFLMSKILLETCVGVVAGAILKMSKGGGSCKYTCEITHGQSQLSLCDVRE